MAPPHGKKDPVEDLDATTLKFGTEFKGASCLLNTEVHLLLQEVMEERQRLQETMPVPPPTPAFTSTLSYCQQFGKYSSRESVRTLRHTLMEAPIEDFERVQLGNLLPESVEEAKQIIPSLRDEGRIGHDALGKILDDLATVTQQ